MEGTTKPVSAKEGKVAVYDYGMTLVDQIEKAHDELWETSNDEDKIAFEARSSEIYAFVCSITADGKPVFSNDGARKAEAAKCEYADPVVKELKAKIRSNDRLVAQNKAKVEALNNRLKIVVAFLRGDE